MPDLPETMTALVLPAPGAPLERRQMPVPKPGPGQVLIQVAASPINPSDLHLLDGEYGVGWAYPLVPGLECSGKVVAAGRGLRPRQMRGRHVAAAALEQGFWAEYAVTEAGRCLPLPVDLPLGMAATALVNPVTALAFMDIARRGGHRSLVSTAAGGGLGEMIRRAAAERGITVINVVRRAAQVAAIEGEVLDQSAPDFAEALKAACDRHKCRLALDAIGGEMTGILASAVRPGGEVLVYGALSGQAAALHPGQMIFRGTTVRGFWLSQWLPRQPIWRVLPLMRRIVAGLRDGGFAEAQVAEVVPLAEAACAPARYAKAMSGGKWLIAPGALPLGIAAGDASLP